MTVLVTGATGTVGRRLVTHLAAAGARVRALSRTPATAALPRGVEVVRGDLADPGSLTGAFDGVVALHLISFAGEAYVPLQTAPEVLGRAAQAGVRRVTVLSGFRPGPVERAVVASGLGWTLLQPVEFMANALAWAPAVRERGVVRAPFGDTRSALVHEDDIAAVAAAALLGDAHTARSYTLTGPAALTTAEAVCTIAAVVGRPVRFEEMSEQEARDELRAAGYAEEDIDGLIALGADPPARVGTVTSTVEEVTGRPARTFREWVEEHAGAFGTAP